jgi:LDH2 family malate/lactate/ureidoglycolate dehydrogenase
MRCVLLHQPVHRGSSCAAVRLGGHAVAWVSYKGLCTQVSPISIGIPAGLEDPIVLDMGAGLGLPSAEGEDSLYDAIPSAYLKELALGAVDATLGGIIPGIYRHPEPEQQWQEPVDPRWIANQGAMIVVIDVGRLLPLHQLKAQVDQFVSEASKMQPFPGMAEAYLPGGREEAYRRQFEGEGVGMTLFHAQTLQEIADRLGLAFPWPRVLAHADAKYAPSVKARL